MLSSITQHNHLLRYHIITICWALSPISIILWYTPITTLKIPVITTSLYTPIHPKYQWSHDFTLPQSPKIPITTTSLYTPTVTQNTSHLQITLHIYSYPKYQSSPHHFTLPQSPKIPVITSSLYTPSHPKYQTSPHDFTLPQSPNIPVITTWPYLPLYGSTNSGNCRIFLSSR